MHQDTAVAIEVYQLLSSIHEQAGDYAAAFRDLQSKIELQQTLGATQRTHQILDLEIKYDIRQKQQAIDQLQRENKYQALLLEQAEQIKRQNVQLLQANDELRQFTYAVSHDLKEPLRMIGSYVQLLHKHLQPQFDEKTQAYYEYVHSGVTRMNRLLDDLLYYSTVDKVASDLQRVSLQECVEMAVINLRMRIEETGAEITSDPLPDVSGIPSLLIQLLQNLMGNAMKFQPENQLPAIHIGATNRDGKVELYVKDNGIGIPADAHERIFELFSRAHRQPIEGTGIGLAICQKIVSRHGGSIRVDSTPGKGSIFYCTLPVFAEI
jgi:light-regulated signal transduction histidine kinase (bacteriophytochrome)